MQDHDIEEAKQHTLAMEGHVDIDEFMKSLKIRITGIEESILDQVTAAIEENMSNEPNVKLMCEWITCKFNSEKGKPSEGQEGACLFIGTIHLKTPVFDSDGDGNCADLTDETMVCSVYQADTKLHPKVSVQWHTVSP